MPTETLTPDGTEPAVTAPLAPVRLVAHDPLGEPSPAERTRYKQRYETVVGERDTALLERDAFEAESVQWRLKYYALEAENKLLKKHIRVHEDNARLWQLISGRSWPPSPPIDEEHPF
jgi:hypothetical protein